MDDIGELGLSEVGIGSSVEARMADDEREWLSDEEIEDAYVERAREDLAEVINARPGDVFYERQLQVRFERRFYHWITSRALDQLAQDGAVASRTLALAFGESGGEVTLRFFFSKKLRYWTRKANEVSKLVAAYCDPAFNAAVGHQAEMLFDAALARQGFLPVAENAREYLGRRWEASGHNLGRIYVRDGVGYGAEIKNKLAYVEWPELEVKAEMCRALGLIPLFIVRAMPKSWIWEVVSKWDGFVLVFGYQLYPFGHASFARRVKETLGLPVDCPRAIGGGTIKRLLSWHEERRARVNLK